MSKPLYIVAVDGSECSMRAAERAINLANVSKATIKLLMVVNQLYLNPMVAEGVAPPVLDQAIENAKITSEVLTPLVAKYSDVNVEISSELLTGDPVDVILAQVKTLHANMLFVGRQGRSRIVDLLLGSVANKLAHRIGVPLVLVP